MFQASVNIDYRKAAAGITIAMLVATMFFGMIPVAFATNGTTPGLDPSTEVLNSVTELLALTKGRIDEAYKEVCMDPEPSKLLQNICLALEKVERA